jgi:hypothetical protein
MKHRITSETAAEYRALAEKAKAIESALMELVIATGATSIPDEAKIKVLNWIDRAETFRGLSYVLTPQTEWMGGDSQESANFVIINPHIAR